MATEALSFRSQIHYNDPEQRERKTSATNFTRFHARALNKWALGILLLTSRRRCIPLSGGKWRFASSRFPPTFCGGSRKDRQVFQSFCRLSQASFAEGFTFGALAFGLCRSPSFNAIAYVLRAYQSDAARGGGHSTDHARIPCHARPPLVPRRLSSQ